MGVGIVTELATREDHLAARPTGPGDALSGPLVARPLGHLFGANVTRVAFKRGAYLRHFVHAFAEQLSDRLSVAFIQRALSGEGDPTEYDL
jgi:LysR family transcriptional regulator, cys regulon transcriptional activator